jgi:hypothetical protein
LRGIFISRNHLSIGFQELLSAFLYTELKRLVCALDLMDIALQDLDHRTKGAGQCLNVGHEAIRPGNGLMTAEFAWEIRGDLSQRC